MRLAGSAAQRRGSMDVAGGLPPHSRRGAFAVLLSAIRSLCLATLFLAPTLVLAPALAAAEFHLSFPAERSGNPIDGRMLLLLSTDPSDEPRFQIKFTYDSQQIFGVDLDGLRPGEPVRFDRATFGWPARSLADIPPGEYRVQAVLHRYETFHRADGHTVKLPMDRGEGQQWNRAPGNLYSEPRWVRFDPAGEETISVVLDREIPPITPPRDTAYVKHIRIQSQLLTKFWGRPMYLGAHVLLPEGFAEHPEVHYPLVIFHGHFPADFSGFRTEPPDPGLKPDFSERFGVSGYNRIVQREAYEFYKRWTGPDFPRMLIVEIHHANPYYDDSYAVNSENLGPYGDAITFELVPYIEKRFRGIGEGWSRFLYGGSTGGWEALAAQIFYPEEYNGAFGACPDPIDFRAYTTVNLYEDRNAYYSPGPFARLRRPGHRDSLGHLSATVEGMNLMELALGAKSRSGQQFDIWEAVYSPVGPDGYPKRIWNKLTGEIDPDVAEHWRENYDLGHILRRDWKTIGPRLQGKLHIYCGDMDNYYLNNAVYLVEKILKSTKEPPYGGEIAYGDRAEHCWNGDPSLPNHISRLRYNTMYIDRILRRIEATAPPNADLTSWRY